MLLREWIAHGGEARCDGYKILRGLGRRETRMFQAVFHLDLQVCGCGEDNRKWGEIMRIVGWGTIESAKTSLDEPKVR